MSECLSRACLAKKLLNKCSMSDRADLFAKPVKVSERYGVMPRITAVCGCSPKNNRILTEAVLNSTLLIPVSLDKMLIGVYY